MARMQLHGCKWVNCCHFRNPLISMGKLLISISMLGGIVMNCKTILATRTTPFSVTVLRITLCLCFIAASSLAHAANVTWSGQLKDILEDSGGAIYSGVAIGTDFSGAINDGTFNGFITDGTTRT